MGIKRKRVKFTFDERSLHVEEPQGYAPRESAHITDVLLMDGRTVRIPPVPRFEEQSMIEHPELERIAAAVHADWVEGKYAQGITSRCGPDGEEYMVPYAELSEGAKDLDRATVRAVLKHLPSAPALASAQGEQARGVLREGLSILLVSAQSAEAARLDQMHNHLDTGHPAAQTDGQAAQIHRLYVQAITQLLASAPAGAE